MSKHFSILLALAGTASIASAQSTAPIPEPGNPPQPSSTLPAYTLIRYDENYAYLHDPSQRTDFFDPIKYIPLGDQPDWYVSLGGQVRDRYEQFNSTTFGAGPQDRDGYNLLRLMANADVHLGPYVRGFVQGLSATEQGREGGPRVTDYDQAELHQGFIDLTLPLGEKIDFTARGGRQDLLFGAQRLIGPADWLNVPRSFDGFRGTLASPGNDLDLFFVRPVMPARYTWDNDIPKTQFAGIYDTWHLPGIFAESREKLELYALYLRRQNVSFPPEGKGREDRYTLGLRFSGNPRPFDFDVEPDYQFGRFGGKDIHAFSMASELGYTLGELIFAPRAFLGFDIASGDGHPNGQGLSTFNQLFPSAHPFFGYIDAIGRQNIIDVHPGMELALLKNKPYAQKLGLRAEYHQFWRESDHDAVYSASGAVLRAGGSSIATSIGSEADLVLSWQIDRHASFYAGYSHFFAGTFLEQTGAHRDIDFFYAAVTYTF
jgi:hypothetical protein